MDRNESALEIYASENAAEDHVEEMVCSSHLFCL